MALKLPAPIRSLLRATRFWKDNYLLLREFKHFPKIAILALVFTLLAATFEGVGIGFLLSFLQSLTTPNAKPVQTGISWFDIWVLGVNTSATSRLYRISALILLTTWTRAGFNYFASVYTELSQYNLVDRLRKQIFEQLQVLSLSFFPKTRSGELINTITTEIKRIKQVFGGFSFLLTSSLTAAIYFISM